MNVLCYYYSLLFVSNIFRHILLKKEEGVDPLPQIIGLTASLGVGKEDDNPSNHYIIMCANLNSTCISYVRDRHNRDELLRHNPKPSQDQIKAVQPRRKDTFYNIIQQMVSCVTAQMKSCRDHFARIIRRTPSSAQRLSAQCFHGSTNKRKKVKSSKPNIL